MRRNIDAWWPVIASGQVESIVINASGCSATVKDYGHALRNDPAYADKAARVSALARDLSELLPDLAPRSKIACIRGRSRPLAFHSPCTLQHGQRLRGLVETHLGAWDSRIGTAAAESHLCCGSAPRISVSASSAEASIRNRLTALSTGVAPSRMRPYIMTVSGESAPTSISVVLKSANDIRNEIAAEPNSAGRRYGSTMVRNTAAREAPRFSAASSSVRSKRRSRALIVSVAIVAMIGELTEHDQRQPGPQKIEVPAETVVGEVGEPAREREDRDAEDHARDHQRRQHQHRQQLLAAKRPRSSRNALLVPTSTDSTVTQHATMQLVQMLPSSSASRNSPTSAR
jgi:hypothetical protein